MNIESLDTENMTDEEIQEVLQSFETSMGSYMKEGFKSAEGMDSTELTEAAKEIILSAGTCTLITLDQEGRPRARIMDAFLQADASPQMEGLKELFPHNRDLS